MHHKKNLPVLIISLLLVLFPLFCAAETLAQEKQISSYEIQKLKIKENEPPYEINCSIPVFKEAQGFDPKELNARIKQLVTERVTESKNGFASREYREKQSSYMEMNFTVYPASARLVSIVFQIESYVAGAAHPIHWSECLTYDKEKNRFLSLRSILNNGDDFVPIISRLCIEQLKTQEGLSDPHWIEEGAGPKAKNFEHFYLDTSGIGIIFDEYKVGPYVAGAHGVMIPYSKIKNLLDPSLGL